MVELIKKDNDKRRLDYLDFCKVFAIFLVTVAHCAQQLSGNKYPDLLLSKDSFISINMPVFMIASGFVMNISKMRMTSTKDYIFSKAYRLILPMTAWYIVMCIVTFHQPRFVIYWSLYWYLGALFVCLSTIKLLTIFISENLIVAFLSIVLLSCIPMISFERSCYMIPFLWMGYAIRKCINRVTLPIVIGLFVVYAIMYYFWDFKYSIYESPFHIWNISSYTVFTLVFRLLIGVIGGIAIIAATRILIKKNMFSWMRSIAKYGPYTLTFYTMSFILNAILARVMWHTNWFVVKPGILDVVAIAVTVLMMIFMYYIQMLLKKNRWLQFVFLGEK